MMSNLHMLAVGVLTPDTTEIRGVSYVSPRTDVVEHRAAHWPNADAAHGEHEVWVGEVRVNLKLTAHATFRGERAQADALAWCRQVAPLASGARAKPMSELLADQARLVAAVRGESAKLAEAMGWG